MTSQDLEIDTFFADFLMDVIDEEFEKKTQYKIKNPKRRRLPNLLNETLINTKSQPWFQS